MYDIEDKYIQLSFALTMINIYNHLVTQSLNHLVTIITKHLTSLKIYAIIV